FDLVRAVGLGAGTAIEADLFGTRDYSCNQRAIGSYSARILAQWLWVPRYFEPSSGIRSHDGSAWRVGHRTAAWPWPQTAMVVDFRCWGVACLHHNVRGKNRRAGDDPRPLARRLDWTGPGWSVHRTDVSRPAQRPDMGCCARGRHCQRYHGTIH